MCLYFLFVFVFIFIFIGVCIFICICICISVCVCETDIGVRHWGLVLPTFPPFVSVPVPSQPPNQAPVL